MALWDLATAKADAEEAMEAGNGAWARLDKSLRTGHCDLAVENLALAALKYGEMYSLLKLNTRGYILDPTGRVKEGARHLANKCQVSRLPPDEARGLSSPDDE